MLTTLFSLLRATARWVRRSILLLGCVFFLTINVLSLTSGLVQSALATSLGALGMHSVYGNLTAAINRQKAAIRTQRKLISGQAQAARKARKALRSHRAVVRKVGSQVTRRTLRLATLNVASIPAEAVPLVGVGVITAVTAYELQQMCQNIRDMNHLYEVMGIAPDVDPGVAERSCLATMEKLDTLEGKFGRRRGRDDVDKIRDGLAAWNDNAY